MSKSYRKAIYKDKGYMKSKYWKVVRSHTKNLIRSGANPMDLPHPKSIINDWDYCDYIIDYEYNNVPEHRDEDYKKKLSRK